MTDVPEETPEQEIDRLRRLVSESPHDPEVVVDLAHALLEYLDAEAELSVVDEPIALLRTALELVGAEPFDRAAINADLADLHAWRCFAAAERGVDTAAADRDTAIEYWAEAEEAAEEAGWLAELITKSPLTVLEQVDLLVARAVDGGAADDLDNAVELAGILVEELPDDDQDRDGAQYAYALARALRYDRMSAQAADLHGAIDDFRELWQRIDEEHPLYADTAAWFGLVLAARVRHDDPEIADHVAEAVAQLEIVDGSVYPVSRLHLGVLLAVRYLYLAGGTEAREAAVAVFRGLLELPELDEFMADVCHAGLALLALAAPGVRRWRLAPGERVLDRLRGEAEEAAWDQASHHLESLTKPARACLLPAVAVPSEDPDEIVESVRLLGMGHPLRGVLLNVFGTTAMSQEVHAEMLALVERALRHIPDDSPWREPALSVLATAGAPAIIDGDGVAVEALRVLLTDVVSRPAADQANRAVNSFLLAFVTTGRGLATQDADLLTEAIQRMRDTTETAPDGHWTVAHAEGMLSSLLNLRWIAGNEREYLDAAVYYSGGKAAAGDGQESAAERVDALTSSLLAQMSSGSSRASSELLSQTIAELDEEGARLPDEHAKRSSAAIVANVARMQLAGRRHGFYSAAVRDSAISFGHVAAAAVMRNDRDPYAITALASARMNSAFARRDLDEVDRALADMAAASTAPKLEGRERAIILTQLGLAFCLRYELTKQLRDLHRGIDRMAEADRLFRQQPGGIFPPLNAMSLAKGYHTRGDKALGDRQRAVATGLEALRDRATDVRVQSGTRRAMDEAATVARDAVEVVRWCLAAERPHSAVTALELGRAMVVHVATSDPSVPEALRARGAHDLATEWEESTQDTQLPWDLPHTDLLRGASPELFAGLAARPIPNDLRRRALRAIGENEEPPTVPEIAGAFQDRETTVLVYLLPRDRYGPGIALLVGQDEKPTTVELSELDGWAGGRIAEMRRVHDELARAEAGTPEWVRLREHGDRAVGEVCDWAWTAAMADVLDAVPAARPARLVMVPVGGLAVVPWHAARRIVGDGRLRYACQDAVISYAASARQFVDANRRPTRPWQSAPGLVRVAESTLYWASPEIEGIRDRYYPDATYLGGRGRRGKAGHRPATTDNVRALLPGLDSPGASVIHLGCHAHLADPPLDSYLSLGDGRLRVGDILNQARQRPLDAPGGLVVLAACTSDASEEVHDESLSLATAFLAAGAAGVVGARWAVDDVPTAAFMIMFHHYLNSGYTEPATALRAAQVWMLNARRRLPAGFDPVLADELTQLDLTGVANWAAFTYQGR